MITLGAIGYGIGSLVDLEVGLGIGGLFLGIFVGLGLVYARFRTL